MAAAPRPIIVLQALPIAAGTYALIGGLVTLLGWFLNIPRLTDWQNNGISMMPNAAACAIGAGVALICLACGWRRIIAILGIFVGLVGAATLFEYFTTIDLGIDRLIIAREWGQRGTVVPGRMGPPASTSWTIIGATLLLASGNARTRQVASVCALLPITIAMLSLIGHLFGASSLFTIPHLTTIALQTSTIIAALGIGLIAVVPEHGLAAALRRDDAGGLILRRLILPLILIPLAVGWLRNIGEQAGLYDASFATAARSLIEILLMVALLWWTARHISRAESKRIEVADELHRSERELSDFFDNASVGLHWVAANGIILRANQHELDLLGYSREEYVGRHIAEFHVDQPVIDDILARLTHGETLQEYPARMRCKDGSILDVLINSSVLFEDGKFIHTRCFTLDITDRKQAEQRMQAALKEAEKSARMKDEFLATLSHELRTPMTAILGWAQMLRKSTPAAGGGPDGDIAPGLEVIERNARLQSQIIDDLLDMSKIVSGKVRLDVQSMDVGKVVEAAVNAITPAAQAKGVRMEMVCDSGIKEMRGDPNRLQQVLYNLLTNAAKFTPKNGKIQVVCLRINSHVEISVSDTGIGIKPEFLPYVFERFRQQDSSTTRAFGGLGLGLAIAKQLVELHGGSIRVVSEGEGKGTTFTVHLPVSIVALPPEPERVEGAERQHPSASSPHAHGGCLPGISTMRDSDGRRFQQHAPDGVDATRLAGVTVLVVDDEHDARVFLQQLLEKYGATAITASSAIQALQVLTSGGSGIFGPGASRTEIPDLILCDIGMPGMDGHELIEKIRALPAHKGGNTPAIALTAFARPADRTKSMRAGFNLHLSKPVEISELLASIDNLAGRLTSED